MSIPLMSTGELISEYLTANDLEISTLIKESGLDKETISLLIEGKIEMPVEVAKAMHRLIPEISEEFLLSYDVKYRQYKVTE